MAEDAAPGRATVLLELDAMKECETLDADAPMEDSLEVVGASFAIQDVWFGADGCELVCVGKQGQFIVLDALSAAVVHSIAASLNCCTGVLSGCRSLSLHPKGCVLVDSDGLVCCPPCLCVHVPSDATGRVLYAICSSCTLCSDSVGCLHEDKAVQTRQTGKKIKNRGS
jgi:hypothetical protein